MGRYLDYETRSYEADFETRDHNVEGSQRPSHVAADYNSIDAW